MEFGTEGMLKELNMARKTHARNKVNYRTVSPLDDMEEDYFYAPQGIPFCENLPYPSWYINKYKKNEDKGKLGRKWAEYLKEQVWVLLYNNQFIEKEEVIEAVENIVKWQNNVGVLRGRNISKVVIWAYYDYPNNWSPKTLVKHWYSQRVEELPYLPRESIGAYIKRKKELKQKLRGMSSARIMRKKIALVSSSYQSLKDGLLPTIDLLAKKANVTRHAVQKYSDEGIHWQKKGEFTGQCVTIAMMNNPMATQKELAEIVSKEFPPGIGITYEGIKVVVRRLKKKRGELWWIK